MRRFEKLEDDLGSKGVRVYAISNNSVAEAQAQIDRDGLSYCLLADPELEIIRKYGLVHRNGLAFITLPILGIPFGIPRGFQEMAIPTTLLIDEEGIVRWVDQAKDYRLRGSRKRTLDALENVFGENS